MVFRSFVHLLGSIADLVEDVSERNTESFKNHALLEIYKSIRTEIIQLETKLLTGALSSAAVLVAALIAAAVAFAAKPTDLQTSLVEFLPLAFVLLGIVIWGMFLTFSVLTIEMLRLGWVNFQIEWTLKLGDRALEHQTWIPEKKVNRVERVMSYVIGKTQKLDTDVRRHRLSIIVVLWLVLSGLLLGIMVAAGSHASGIKLLDSAPLTGVVSGAMASLVHWLVIKLLPI